MMKPLVFLACLAAPLVAYSDDSDNCRNQLFGDGVQDSGLHTGTPIEVCNTPECSSSGGASGAQLLSPYQYSSSQSSHWVGYAQEFNLGANGVTQYGSIQTGNNSSVNVDPSNHSPESVYKINQLYIGYKKYA